MLFWPLVWKGVVFPSHHLLLSAGRTELGIGGEAKKQTAILDFKDLFPVYFSSIFFISFFTSTELGLGFPRRTREMDGPSRGAGERAASSK